MQRLQPPRPAQLRRRRHRRLTPHSDLAAQLLLRPAAAKAAAPAPRATASQTRAHTRTEDINTVLSLSAGFLACAQCSATQQRQPESFHKPPGGVRPPGGGGSSMAFRADRAAFQPRGARAGVPPGLPGGAHAGTRTLARPRHLARHLHNHTHTRTKDTNADQSPSLGLVNGGFWVHAQHSARQRQTESFRKPPGVGALVVVGVRK